MTTCLEKKMIAMRGETEGNELVAEHVKWPTTSTTTARTNNSIMVWRLNKLYHHLEENRIVDLFDEKRRITNRRRNRSRIGYLVVTLIRMVSKTIKLLLTMGEVNFHTKRGKARENVASEEVVQKTTYFLSLHRNTCRWHFSRRPFSMQ